MSLGTPGLRYSDRKRMAETGSLGDLAHENVPEALATAVRSLVESSSASLSLTRNIENACVQHFGIEQRWFTFFFAGSDVDTFLDAVEYSLRKRQRHTR